MSEYLNNKSKKYLSRIIFDCSNKKCKILTWLKSSNQLFSYIPTLFQHPDVLDEVSFETKMGVDEVWFGTTSDFSTQF